MNFKVLGPLEVLDGDRPIAIGGTRQRALLALLLLHANEVVSADRLLAELWGDDGGSPKVLQVAIYGCAGCSSRTSPRRGRAVCC